MHVNSGLAIASILTAATALAFNRTIETVTVTQTSWSTITSTLACPAPTTVTVCNAQCPGPVPVVANSANIVYETLSEYRAGQVLTIGDQVTTLAGPTVLTIAETISDLVIAPDYATNVHYSAVATVTDIVYPSSLTGSSGQVVTCETGVTTIIGNEVVLTNCPCTVQSTVLEITATATGSGAMPTALVPSSGYIVKIIYVYLIETVISETVTTITRTATTTLTTVQTQTGTATATITTTTVPRPTIIDVDRVTYLLEYDTIYDSIAINNLRKRQAVKNFRKRQAISLPGVSAVFYGCLASKFTGKRSFLFHILKSSSNGDLRSLYQLGRLYPGDVLSYLRLERLPIKQRLVSNDLESCFLTYKLLDYNLDYQLQFKPEYSFLNVGPFGCFYDLLVQCCIVTTSAPASTAFSDFTLPPVTTIETVETATLTTLYISSELTVTDTATEVTMTTVTSTVSPILLTESPVLQRRQAQPTAQASIFSSILSRPSSDVEFVCSCLQTPTTASVTVTQTALSTTVVTLVVSNNVTITPPVVTIQSTYTATITIPETTITGITTTTTTTTFSTVETSTVPVCAAYGFVALNGPNPGQYFTTEVPSGGSALTFTTDASKTTSFSYDLTSRKYTTIGSDLIFVDSPGGIDGIGVVTEDFSNQEDFATIVCTMTPASDLSYGAIFTATCTPDRPSATGSYSFYVNNGLLSISPSGQGNGDSFDLGVVC
ncbi:hypothetical protein E4T45_00582 [Aureobasidium sp. EXF-8846]|nr:hypothetical protein E4T45_00582 [Aureobasidium sp. EXF-8846]